MSASVLVIWLDSAEPTFVEAMMAAGELPHLARLRQRGIYGRLKAPAFSLPETAYGMVLTGQPPQLT